MSLKTDGTLGDKLNDSKHDNMKTPQVHAAVTHHMHDMSTQDGIQNMFPKENSVNDHQGMSRVNRNDSACNAALLSDQDRPARGIFSETASGRHGESPRAELSRPHADHAHGWKSDGLSHPRRSSAGLGEASGYQYSHGLGVSQSSIGQACFKELRGHLRTGPGLSTRCGTAEGCPRGFEVFRCTVELVERPARRPRDVADRGVLRLHRALR